ncbi:MAG: M48 family metallopeptidase [Flammeovirgaceae bacterium]
MEAYLLHLIVGIITAEFLLERTLSILNAKHRNPNLPQSLQGIYDQEKYAKSQQYSADRERVGWISAVFSFIVTVSFLVLGGFGWVDSLVAEYTQHPIWSALLFFGVLGLGSSIIGLPFSIYNTFVIEERYGFNKTTVKTFIGDIIKGMVISMLIGGVLLGIFIWFHNNFDLWWVYAWAIFLGFTLFITMFYTSVLVPIFNKLTPLEDGELKSAILAYAQEVDFPLKNIMVIDGSKRSTKGNAYFSGLGSSKNIVLYDTLIEKHSIDELVAVLAHEVGHYKKKHVLQGFVIGAIQMFVMLFIMQWIVDNPALSIALGGSTEKLHLGLIAFTILYSPISTLTGLFMNVFSRKNEYEADAYAAKTYEAKPLMDALKKLSVDSLSNLTPHPAYVFFHYSHPTLLQRMAALGED